MNILQTFSESLLKEDRMKLPGIVYINLDETKWAMLFETDFLKVKENTNSYVLKDLKNILFKTKTIDGATLHSEFYSILHQYFQNTFGKRLERTFEGEF